MTDLVYSALIVGVIALVTALLRFLPFWIFGSSSPVPKVIRYLGSVLPYSVMGMLVVYCLKNVSFTEFKGFLPSLISVAVVVLLHIWKRNTLLSILGGTALYMVLIRLLGSI